MAKRKEELHNVEYQSTCWEILDLTSMDKIGQNNPSISSRLLF